MTRLACPMTIKWRLSAVMADREIDNQKLHELTGLHLGTISKLRNNAPARVDTKTLDMLCVALDCQPGELLVYVPDGKQTKTASSKQSKGKEPASKTTRTQETSSSGSASENQRKVVRLPLLASSRYAVPSQAIS